MTDIPDFGNRYLESKFGRCSECGLWEIVMPKGTVRSHRVNRKRCVGSFVAPLPGTVVVDIVDEYPVASTWEEVMDLWPLPAPPTRHGTSRYRGVSYDRQRSRWVASCGKSNNVGVFHSERDAAIAAEKAAELVGTSRRPTIDEAASLSLIPLSRGKQATIDLFDLPVVAPYTWSVTEAAATKGLFYATTTIREKSGRRKGVPMHRLLMPEVASTSTLQIDHKNGNGLDNRRCNLRAATGSQNMRNRGSKASSTSKYIGVSRAQNGLWRASLLIGNFENEGDAARAYDRFAILVDSEFARLNFPEEETH